MFGTRETLRGACELCPYSLGDVAAPLVPLSIRKPKQNRNVFLQIIRDLLQGVDVNY